MRSDGTSIRWLHLSDLHIKADDWSQDVVLASLLTDVCERYRGAGLNFIFITGDISYSGQRDQYTIAKDFIRRLASALEIPTERIFLVPGNHDIDRSLEEDAFAGARSVLRTQHEVDRFFGNAGRRKTLFRRQLAYREFASQFAVPDYDYTDSSFAHFKSVQVGPVTLHILMLDSAWLAEGDSGDHGRLLVGEPQIYEVYRALEPHGLTIGLMHHPFSWLSEFESLAVENLLIKRLHVLLRGHVHTSDVTSLTSRAQRLTIFTAGAGFESRTSNNSYAVCALDLYTGQGTITTHRYVHHTKRWDPAAPDSWILADPQGPGVPLEQAVSFFVRGGAKFPNYGAALVSGVQAEVPLVVGSSLVYVSHDADLPVGDRRPSGVIARLRHLSRWRPIWAPPDWERALMDSIRELDGLLGSYAELDADAGRSLAEREASCRRLVDSLRSQRPSALGPAVDYLRALVSQRDWNGVVEVAGRWRDAAVLTIEEKQDVRRALVQAYAGLGRSDEAVAELEGLLETKQEIVDLELAAASCHALKKYSLAAAFMHRALDAGAEVSAVRGLAIAIAGNCGDAKLVERVRSR